MPNLSRNGSCSIDGCERPIQSKRMCGLHYQRWYHHGDPLCEKRLKLAVVHIEFKVCDQCGGFIMRLPKWSCAQWERKRYCSTVCANTWRARRQKPKPATLRRRGERWARWWERERRSEDRADLARRPKVWPHCKMSQRPQSRLFISRCCSACGAMWVSYAARHDTGYCSDCNTRRWASDCRHKRRARIAATRTEVISPDVVFERDGYRCQICQRKTSGKFPATRSATLDHIVPLALGGTHTYDNVQCACFDCNSRKGRRFIPTQLNLAA